MITTVRAWYESYCIETRHFAVPDWIEQWISR